MAEGSDKKFYFSLDKKLFYLFIIILFAIALALFASSVSKVIKDNLYNKIPFCGDCSFPGTCSLTKPYYCSEEGYLIYNPDGCGCPSEFFRKNNECVSTLQINSSNILLNYNLNGEKKIIDYPVYEGVSNHLYSLKQSVSYDGEIFSRADFKLRKMDDSTQYEFLMPLVVEIQNLAPHDKDEQARIAISIVQNIPFNESNKTYKFGSQEVTYSRYPYQVLYDYAGICGEKTELLAFILRELGYGVSFFYYPDENHEAIGIKCPVERSFSSTGYCFVETTAPSIISDSKINYANIGKLYSVPELYFISEGLTFGNNNFYEYNDAKKIIKIRNSIEKRGWIGPLKKMTYNNLKEKYGLVDEYYSG